MAVSNPGAYEGYSEEIYDGVDITSQYITMYDGCKLAIDIYRPTKDGKLHEEPLPVIWTATQYRRALMDENGNRSNFEDTMGINLFSNHMPTILKHGYVLAALDVRGSGASFGQRTMNVSTKEFYDLYEVNEWLAAQPFCNGSTGMFGLSYLGQTQWECACMAPPSLKCIAPNVAPLELPYLFTNGVPNIGWLNNIDELLYDQNVVHPSPGVDEDVDGSMLRAAIEEHKLSPSSMEERRLAPHYDDVAPHWKSKTFLEAYMPNYIYNLNNSNIACFIWGGWKDFFGTDPYDWYNSITVPKKLVVGNWFHDESRYNEAPVDYTSEMLRWYDYWLKDIDNGIMDEPPVLLYNNGTDEWRWYDAFPIEAQDMKPYYISSTKAGSIESRNDGSLLTKQPVTSEDSETFTVDYSVTKRGFEDRFFYTTPGDDDYQEFDKKSITYTTAPFAEDTEITGFPIVELWISTAAKDLDFYCNIQDVDENGVSHNVSEGRMRASYRALHNPPFNHMGLPYHRLYRQDQKDLPENEPVLLTWNLFAMSNTIKAGHRLRVTFNNADKDNWDTPELDPAPQVTIWHNAQYPSVVRFPIIPKGSETGVYAVQHYPKREIKALFAE